MPDEVTIQFDKQSQQALEAYVEDTSDKSQMRFCASYLHQVQGTLRMVELYGAAMVVEEMERLALGLLDGQVKQADDAMMMVSRFMVCLFWLASAAGFGPASPSRPVIAVGSGLPCIHGTALVGCPVSC